MSEDGVPAPSRKRPSGLGRGLSALLGEIEREEPVSLVEGAVPANGGIRMVNIGDLSPLPGQPRRHFDDDALNELAQSIAARGLLQPIVVRSHKGMFQIVAGERRWRAAQRASLHQVPVIIKEFDDSTALEVALIENIQREQLNALEEGAAYMRLIDDYGHTQIALGALVHKSRSHISNLIRLLDLPELVRAAIADGRLSMGHARALVTAENPVALMDEILKRGLSVRDTEKLAKAAKPGAAKRSGGNGGRVDPDLAALERQLGDILGLKVRINHGPKGGAVTLGYSSLDQLDLICQRLSGERI
jgi:ParB family transcriptional regulator, chromosome partitioning protein